MADQIDQDNTGDTHASGVSDIAQEWIVRLVSGRITAEELRLLKAWLAEQPSHQRAFDRERTVWQQLDQLQHVSAALLEEDRRTPEPPARLRRHGRRYALVGGLAAACLAFIVLYQDIRAFLLADHHTGVGHVQVVTLPDGGLAHLNSDTAIAVSYTDHERRVDLLRGEALFEVVSNPQRPFRVAAQDGVTQAVGTAFVVRADPQQTRITVVEGTVGVFAGTDVQTGQQVIVRKDQHTVYRPGETPQDARPADGGSAKAWSQGIIAIEGQPFAQAMAELDRYRPGRIVVLADRSRTKPVSGRFKIQKVDDAISALAKLQGLQVVHVAGYFVFIL
ncbi:putative iron acquisition-like protein [Nitrospira japonica]|uniref:Putative iron acquisition-like protein n=1 Tax=Nitrospira japonica TaxID=1325564 RepID=A0A1W1I7H3_9BACT|nr:FecR domain-containing protein [Nitrospira japonica]SLM48871.1 putative iron acquisition-like protein [Nitrospira japonica]